MKEEMMHIVKKDKKKLMILGIVAVISVFLLILGSEISSSSREMEKEDKVVSADSDESGIEPELEQILGSMVGVGKVDVVISYDGEIAEQYAYNEEKTEVVQEDGTREIREKKELVLVDGDGAPVVTMREHPEIKGVLVSAEGASNDKVREKLVDAVASYLDIGKNRIEVTAMEVQR